MSTTKKNYGRQKIEMKRMENKKYLQVTFSKRRNGLFKKASELCTLCDANVALVVFSPSNRVFSFGHPNAEAVIDRYLTSAPSQNLSTIQFIESHHSANVEKLNAELTQINNQLDAERKHGQKLDHLRKEAQAQFWWATPIEKMNKAQLQLLKVALEDLKKHVAQLVEKPLGQNVENPNHFDVGSSSSNLVTPPQVLPFQLLQPPKLHNDVFDVSMMSHLGFNNKYKEEYKPIRFL